MKAYSKGMRQRIKLAQCIAHDPQLILLDEPLNGVDRSGARPQRPHAAAECTGHHLIVSSHVLYEVERLTEQIVMIAHGQAIAQGDLHRIATSSTPAPTWSTSSTGTPRSRPSSRGLGPRRVDRVHGPREASGAHPFPGGVLCRPPALVVTEKLTVRSVHSADNNWTPSSAIWPGRTVTGEWIRLVAVGWLSLRGSLRGARARASPFALVPSLIVLWVASTHPAANTLSDSAEALFGLLTLPIVAMVIVLVLCVGQFRNEIDSETLLYLSDGRSPVQ